MIKIISKKNSTIFPCFVKNLSTFNWFYGLHMNDLENNHSIFDILKPVPNSFYSIIEEYWIPSNNICT